MSKSILLIISVLLLLTCKPEKPKKSTVDDLVKSLTTVELQKEFLENINDEDQGVRGHKSTSETERLMGEMDKTNIEKIEAYLKIHGHPNAKEHGRKASNTPSLVIHHQPDIEVRERNFEYLYKAYLEGNLSETSFTFYLNRWYAFKYKKRIDWEGPFNSKQELDTLFSALDLNTRAIEVENNSLVNVKD